MRSKNSSCMARWQNQFAAASLEKDPYRLAKSIEAAEAAVLLRLETITAMCAVDRAEGNALAEALNQLEILKRERLGFVVFAEQEPADSSA